MPPTRGLKIPDPLDTDDRTIRRHAGLSDPAGREVHEELPSIFEVAAVTVSGELQLVHVRFVGLLELSKL